MATSRIINVIIIMFFITGCTTARKSGISETESIKAKELLAVLSGINSKSPETISSSFSSDGNMGEKKFRVEGKVDFDRNGYYRVSVSDYIFKSPVIEVYRELDRLYFYYPAEKKLLVDDINKIDLSRYTGFNMDYSQLYALLSGGVPLIDKYTVYKCLYDEAGSGYNLILENEEFFETIFFKDNLPEKILFIHKTSRNKAEIYLKSITGKDKSVFFRNLKIVVPEMNTGIDIKFIKPVLNSPVTVQKFDRNRLPKKVETIIVN